MKRFLPVFLSLIYACSSPEPHKKIMSYKIVGPGTERYDEAITYTVLISECSPGDHLKDSIKSIIDDLATKEHTNKFSVDIYDNEKVVDFIMETEVKRTRIASKKELRIEQKEIGEHCIAYYNGELLFEGKADSGYKHELNFFPYIEEANPKSPKVKMSETIEYTPKQ